MASQINASNSGFGGIVSTGDSSGVLELQTTGTTAVTIDTSQRVGFVAGTAAAPAITRTGDTNTGMFFPAADTIAFTEGGTEAMRLDSSGNLLVGISTTGSTGINIANNYNLGWGQGSGESIPNLFRQSSSAATVLANGYRQSATAGGFSSSYSSSWAKSAISCGTVAGNITFYTDTAAAVAAGTDVTPSERMRIDSSGNLLVGGTSPVGSSRLLVKGSGSSSGTTNLYVQNSSSADILYMRDDGAINTGTTTSSPYNLTTGSGANAVLGSDGFLRRSTSSLKYKTDIQDITHGLSEVMQLRPVTYKGKEDGDKIFGGLIAEEVDAIGLKEFVEYAEDGSPDALSYGHMVSLLTKAIQEQQTIINDLKARIETLESK